MGDYVLIIHKTNNYPFYEKTEERFGTMDVAEKRMDEVSKSLMSQCRAGTLQDYSLEIRKV